MLRAIANSIWALLGAHIQQASKCLECLELAKYFAYTVYTIHSQCILYTHVYLKAGGGTPGWADKDLGVCDGPDIGIGPKPIAEC